MKKKLKITPKAAPIPAPYKSVSHPGVGDIAFWYYDIYPYTLYGEITKFIDTYPKKENIICVETKEYGKGQWFRPFLVLAPEDAAQLIARLKELKEGRQQLIDVITLTYQTNLKDILPQHPVFKK